ncbi:hypothetical protein BG006_001304, partial [Podila minutissima]
MLSIPSRSTKFSPLLFFTLFLSFLTKSVLSSCCYSYTGQEIKASDSHKPPPTSYSIDLTASSQPAVDSPQNAYHTSITFPSNYIILAIPTGCVSVSVTQVNCTSTGAAQLKASFSNVIAAGVSYPVFESVTVNGETCTLASFCPVPLLPAPGTPPRTTTSSTTFPSTVPSTIPPRYPPVSQAPAPIIPGNGDMPMIIEPATADGHSMRIILLGVTIPVLVLMAILGYCLWRRHRAQHSSGMRMLHDKDSSYSVGSDPFGEKGAMRYEHAYRSSYTNEKDNLYGQTTYRSSEADAGTGTRPPQYEENPPQLHGLGMTLVDIPAPSNVSDVAETEADINYFQGEDDSVERSSESDIDSFVHFDHRSMDLTLAALARPVAALTTSGGAEVSVDGGMTGAQNSNTNMQRSKSIRYPFNASANGASSVTVTANLQRSVSCTSSIDSTKSQRLRNELLNFQGPLHLQSQQIQEEQADRFRPSSRQSIVQQKVPMPYSSMTSLRPLQVPATITRSVSMVNRPSSKGQGITLTSEPIIRPPRSVHRKPSRETLSGLSRSSSVASSHSLALVEEEIIRSFSSSSGRNRRGPPAPLMLTQSTRSLLRPGRDNPIAAVDEMGEEEIV